MRLWEAIRALLPWARAREAEVDAEVKCEIAAADTATERPMLEACALPGFYSVHADGDELVVLRSDDGGVTIVAKVEREADAVASERCIRRGAVGTGTIFRLTAKPPLGGGAAVPVIEAKGANYIQLGSDGAMNKVARDGDQVDALVNMAAWMLAVTNVCNAVAPGSVPAPPSDIGYVIASTTKLYGY